jgi:Tol biopolymer transport system component
VVELAWFDRSGKLIESIEARENWGLGRPALSPGSNRAAISMVDPSNPKEEIWLWDLVRGSKSRFTFGTHDRNARSAPVWSPDGRRIVFEHSGVSDHGLYWKDTGGVDNEKLLLKTAHDSWPCDWSPDGRFILFTQENAERKTEMSVLPLFGNRSPVLVQQTEFNEGGGVFSPDGHWIAYISDESGRDEIYVRSFTEGGAGIAADKFPVSTSGGELPRWRRDGKELYFSALDGKLMSVPVKAGSTFVTGKPVVLFDTHLGSDFHYDVRFDGERFLMIQRLSEGTSRLPVNVCLNWLAGIKK